MQVMVVGFPEGFLISVTEIMAQDLNIPSGILRVQSCEEQV